MWKKKLLIMFVCLFVLGVAQINAEEQDLTIITEDWPPYNYEENGKIKGFSVDIVHAIMQELGKNYKISLLPGARGEFILRTKSNVMSFSLFRTPERENL
ncbi:transporter substrate-binding domain-containing protein [Desulfobacterales bacterium HSG17]|nr:transporter substrate-binding domain-containing protein [Desulfobacterales bacterium HSG17]